MHGEEAYLDVYLPKRYQGNLKAKTVSGSFQLTGLNLTGLDFHSVSGDITLEKLESGRAELETTSGEMVLRGCSGDYDLKTVSGDIDNQSFSGRMNVKTVSGDIDTLVEQKTDPMSLETTSGDVRIGLPREAKFSFKFETVSGDYHSDIPVQLTNTESKRRLEGSTGTSDGRIEVHTISGNLKIMENQ